MNNIKFTKVDNLAVSAIRSLCIDEINKAKSGHPGMALGSAPILHVLYKNHLTSDPHNPTWVNRDRFVLSAGHASSLLYAMLHVCDYGLSIDELKNFRQLDSLTPGHPEYMHTKGVDATSGPLGQGIAQAVGLAVAEQSVREQYSFGKTLIDHYTYVLCGDGCLQEGLSQEAISFAGHQKLNKLVLIYDSNNITLDGDLEMSFSENVKMRFIASNWNVLEVENGNSLEDIDLAISQAKESKEKPTLIIVKTIIGFGSANQGTCKVHGNPLGEDDGENAKKSYEFDFPKFTVPQEVYEMFQDTFVKRGKLAIEKYNDEKHTVFKNNKNEMKVFDSVLVGDLSDIVESFEYNYNSDNNDSTRISSGKILNELVSHFPYLIGGSADVAKSVMTTISEGSYFAPSNRKGQMINFGIREFAMASIQNGMLLHGGLRGYVGSFLVFADYMKSAIRTSALSNLPAIYLFSHDSIAVGEDGPTHQPIEHLAMLRSIPNLNVLRPSDVCETLASYKIAMKSNNVPSALILSRQNLPLNEGSNASLVEKGAYVVSLEKKKAVATIIATGSEVHLAINAQKQLFEEGIDVRVVSMPSTFLFDKQTDKYKSEVMGNPKKKCVAVEMLSSFGWYKYADTVMSIDTFGTSAPMNSAINKFDFTSEHLVQLIKKTIKA